MANNDEQDPNNPTTQEEGFSVPGITDLPQRLSRALGEALGGPGRVLSSAASDLLTAATGTAEKKDQDLKSATQTVARAAGGAVVESARVVEDVAGRFVRPGGASGPKMVRTGNRVYPSAPFQLEDTSLHAFFIPASKSKLQEYLDKVFKEPTAGEVTLVPACSYIVSFVGDTKKLRTDNTDEHRKGYLPDVDSALWVFALRTRPTPALFFVPLYHFVRASPTMAAGREIYGFPKQTATFPHKPDRIESDGTAPDLSDKLLEIEPLVLTKLDDPNEPLGPHTVLTISVPKRSTLHARDLDMEALFKDIITTCVTNGTLDPTLDIDRHIKGILKLLGIDPDEFKARIPILLLKQIPSVADSSRCAYQAVVKANIRVKKINVHGLETIKDVMLDVADYPTHPFGEIGLEAGSHKISECVFWMNADLVLDKGYVVWEAS